jgi:hypothetical protein
VLILPITCNAFRRLSLISLCQDQLGTKSRILGIYVEHYMVKYKIISPLYERG